ncbi:replication-relaxation family protein [Actinokineospora spheciospongiae]|uniref:replication-relaxation family protein n=1 Tax=Actinokineospora spheciospongiae TaxID=909613 RepID=UPI000D70C91A|nr:replication-relaxation family protein [Actinokineospora spheciospongiae]PWW53677.1 protein involved in plasmid replication-relaxation [Actinokineospora spheciospongiae]
MSARARRVRQQLGERDLELLHTLANLRLMTGQQIRRLLHPDGNRVTQARKVRALLVRLAELGVVVRLARRVGGIYAGSEGHVIGLSGLGHAVLAVGTERAGQRHRGVSDTKLAFQEHVLQVSELFVSLKERELTGHAELLVFDGEPAAWRRFSGYGGGSRILKPDAFLRLGIGDVELHAFAEMDLATESGPTLARKLSVYVDYWRSGAEQAEHGIFPEVWWLVPDSRRAAVLSRLIGRLPADARDLFVVALIEQAADQLTTEGGNS